MTPSSDSSRALTPGAQVAPWDPRRLLSHPAVYGLFSGLIGGRRARRRYVRDFVAPFAGARILDIGCGTANILEALPPTVTYVGYDGDESYIRYARARWSGRGTFRCARVSEMEAPIERPFDIVLAAALLHHLDDDEARQLIAAVHASLRPGGHFVTIDNVYVAGQSRLARFIVSRDRGTHIRTPDEYVAIAGTRFAEVEATILHNLLAIPYTHFVMKCVRDVEGSA
jgi:SAM-dependent methyltransferase